MDDFELCLKHHDPSCDLYAKHMQLLKLVLSIDRQRADQLAKMMAGFYISSQPEFDDAMLLINAIPHKDFPSSLKDTFENYLTVGETYHVY